jgi:hypothetical protein
MTSATSHDDSAPAIFNSRGELHGPEELARIAKGLSANGKTILAEIIQDASASNAAAEEEREAVATLDRCTDEFTDAINRLNTVRPVRTFHEACWKPSRGGPPLPEPTADPLA